MDRSQFLRNLRASKVKLHPVQIDGWEGLVYLRPQTLGEIRDVLMKVDGEGESEDLKKSIGTDPLYLARGIARLVRDEEGVLLFDADDNVQMVELMRELEGTAPEISRRLNLEFNAINAPSTAEVTPSGN